MEISPEVPEKYPEEKVCYAIRRNRFGRLSVDIVDAHVATRLVDNQSQADGTIVYKDLDPEVDERLYVERDVEDVEPEEVESYKFGTDTEQ
jgi:hypothetical protein